MPGKVEGIDRIVVELDVSVVLEQVQRSRVGTVATRVRRPVAKDPGLDAQGDVEGRRSRSVDIGGGDDNIRRNLHLDRAVRLVVLEAEGRGDRQGLRGVTVVGHGDLAGDAGVLGPVDEAEGQCARLGLAVPRGQVGTGNGAIHADLTGTDALDRRPAAR